MKLTLWTTFAALTAITAWADRPLTSTQPQPQQPPQAAQPARQAGELRTVPLVAGPAVVTANRVNVRGQARLRSEIITKLTNGEPVTVIEEVQLKRSAPDEPSAWAKIVLPQKAKVWVHGNYIDPATMTVKANRLNLRGGPGENYSILGTLQRGDAVQEVRRQGEWIEIEPPADAYAFVAAQYLSQDAQQPPVDIAQVEEGPGVAPETTTDMPEPEPTTAAQPTPEEIEPEEEAPLPPRIVQREGIVRGTYSVQAPTRYQLVSPDNYRTMNYLHTTSTNLDLSRYKGLRIVVTGEEALDKRWKNTPLITIQRIQVLE